VWSAVCALVCLACAACGVGIDKGTNPGLADGGASADTTTARGPKGTFHYFGGVGNGEIGPENGLVLTARTMKLDGTGGAALKEWPVGFDIEDVTIATPSTYPVRDYDHTEVDHSRALNRGAAILLPGSLGRLYLVSTTKPAAETFVQVKADGTVRTLSSVSGKGTFDGFYPMVSFSPDSAILAVAHYNPIPEPVGFKLIRLDGKKFSHTKSAVCDFSPAAPPAGFTFWNKSVFVFSEKRVWFQARGWHRSFLFSAPLDCSARAAVVKLPDVAGSTPDYLGLHFGISADRRHLMVVGSQGLATRQADVILVDALTQKAVNFTSTASHDYFGGGLFFKDVFIALSPGNKHLAYIAFDNSGMELYVRPTDRSQPAVKVTDAKSFPGAKMAGVSALAWTSADDLLFWAGAVVGGRSQDLYHYRLSTGALANLTGTGDATWPFVTPGKLSPDGGWRSPDGKQIYFLQQRAPVNTTFHGRDLQALDLTTMKLRDVFTGRYVSDVQSARGASNRVFFVESGLAGKSKWNLWFFDQGKTSRPVKLTHFSVPNKIHSIIPNHDGTVVALLVSQPGSGRINLYLVQVNAGGTPVQRKLTSGPGIVLGGVRFTLDGKSVLWGRAPEHAHHNDLRISSLDGSGTRTLVSRKQVNLLVDTY